MISFYLLYSELLIRRSSFFRFLVHLGLLRELNKIVLNSSSICWIALMRKKPTSSNYYPSPRMKVQSPLPLCQVALHSHLPLYQVILHSRLPLCQMFPWMDRPFLLSHGKDFLSSRPTSAVNL